MGSVQATMARPKGSADRLAQLAAADMAAVDVLVRERCQSPVPLIPALAEHLIGAGGKRVRP